MPMPCLDNLTSCARQLPGLSQISQLDTFNNRCFINPVNHFERPLIASIVILVIGPPLTLSAPGIAFEMLLAGNHSNVLGVYAVVERNHGSGLSTRQELSGCATLFGVLVVKWLADMCLAAVRSEEALVEPFRLGSRGDGNHVRGHGRHVVVSLERESVDMRHESGTTLLGQVILVVEVLVELLLILDTGWRRNVEQLARDVVLEDVSGGS